MSADDTKHPYEDIAERAINPLLARIFPGLYRRQLEQEGKEPPRPFLSRLVGPRAKLESVDQRAQLIRQRASEEYYEDLYGLERGALRTPSMGPKPTYERETDPGGGVTERSWIPHPDLPGENLTLSQASYSMPPDVDLPGPAAAAGIMEKIVAIPDVFNRLKKMVRAMRLGGFTDDLIDAELRRLGVPASSSQIDELTFERTPGSTGFEFGNPRELPIKSGRHTPEPSLIDSTTPGTVAYFATRGGAKRSATAAFKRGDDWEAIMKENGFTPEEIETHRRYLDDIYGTEHAGAYQPSERDLRYRGATKSIRRDTDLMPEALELEFMLDDMVNYEGFNRLNPTQQLEALDGFVDRAVALTLNKHSNSMNFRQVQEMMTELTREFPQYGDRFKSDFWQLTKGKRAPSIRSTASWRNSYLQRWQRITGEIGHEGRYVPPR